jgi:hypothetical protein
MAHFAEIDQNNKVLRIIVVSDGNCGGGQFPESESIGQMFIASLGITGTWKQTSLNNNFRKCYANIDSVYVPEKDIFTSAQPFPSWKLDSNYEWQAPIAKPDQDGFWFWDEANQKWVR